MGTMPATTLTLDGKDYVVLPKNEYYRLLGKAPPDAVDAAAFAKKTIGENLKKARLAGRLTKAELARQIGTAAATVTDVETGLAVATPKYIALVLRACGLPKDWKAPV